MLDVDGLEQTGLAGHSLRDIARALRERRVSAVNLLDHAKQRYAALEPALHGYVAWNPDLSTPMAEAADTAFRAGSDRGHLQGITMSIKDIFGVKGYETKVGSCRAFPEKFNQEGPLLTALRGQCTVFTGKTQTDEFAYAGLGTVNDGPIPRNPWDGARHRAAGGSSSGAPVSLWQETALVALATDTSGSVRRPAALTGTAGLKLTVGRWPADFVPLCPTMDTPGILTRSVDDLRFAFYAIDTIVADKSRGWHEPEITPGDITMAICDEHMWDECDPGVAEAVQAAIKELTGAGVKCLKISVPEVSDAYQTVLDGGIVSSEFMAFVEKEVPEWLDILQPQLKIRLAGPDRPNLSAVQYLQNLREIRRCAEAVIGRLEGIDVLVGPTLPITPPLLEDVAAPEAWQAINKRAVKNTYIASLLGLCGITLPVGLDANHMPVGMQMLAKPWQEERLLDIGCAFERILGQCTERLGRPPMV